MDIEEAKKRVLERYKKAGGDPFYQGKEKSFRSWLDVHDIIDKWIPEPSKEERRTDKTIVDWHYRTKYFGATLARLKLLTEDL